MAGWHHQLNAHEFEQTPGVGDGQGGLVCCSPWGCKELGHDLATQQQHQNNINFSFPCCSEYSLNSLKNYHSKHVSGAQWLRLHAPNAEGPGSIPGHGT